MFESCNSLKDIDLSNFNATKYLIYKDAFKDVFPNGTLKYNSEIFNPSCISYLKEHDLINWNFTDVKNSSYSLNK